MCLRDGQIAVLARTEGGAGVSAVGPSIYTAGHGHRTFRIVTISWPYE